MVSKFELLFSRYFIGQWESYSSDTQELLNSKFSLISTNPFRFDRHKGYKGVYKIKLDIENKYSRLMYIAHYPDQKSITILGIFPRSRNYNDFDRIFGYLRK